MATPQRKAEAALEDEEIAVGQERGVGDVEVVEPLSENAPARGPPTIQPR